MRQFYLYRLLGLVILLASIGSIRQYHKSFYNAKALTKTFEESLNNVERDVATTLSDHKPLLQLLNTLKSDKKLSNKLIDELDILAKKTYSIYLYRQNELVFWSRPGLVIDPSYLRLTAFPVVLSDHRNDFLIKRYLLHDGANEYTAFAKIPILDQQTNIKNVSVTPLTMQNKFERISTETTVHSIEGDAVCEIKVIGTSYPQVSQYAILIMSLFIFILVGSLMLKAIDNYRSVVGPGNANLLQIIAMIGLRVLSFCIPYHQQFIELPVAQNLFENPIFSYALIDLLLDSAIVLWIASRLSEVLAHSFKKEKERKIVTQTVSIGYYLILIVLIGLLSWLMRSVVIFSNINLDLENISFFNYQHFICISSFGLITLACLVIVHELIRQNIQLIPNLYVRLMHLVIAGAISLLYLHLIPIGTSLFGFFLAVFISSVLLDLFIEKGSRSVIWVITWLIAIAGFSSVLLFKYQQDSDYLQRVQTLREVEQMILEEPDNISERLVEWLPRKSPKFSLGIYKNDQVIFNDYKFEYPVVLSELLKPNDADPVERQVGPRNEVSLQAADNVWLFAGKQVEGPLGVISLFSYIFTIYSILLFFIALVNGPKSFLPSNFNISFSSKPTLKNKIQLAIVFIILLTFVIIGLVTVLYMRSNSQQDSDRRYEDKLQTLATSINETISSKKDSLGIAQAAQVAYANNQQSKIYDASGNLIFRPTAYSDIDNPPPVKISFKSKMILDYSSRDYTLERSESNDNQHSIGFIGVKKNAEQEERASPEGYVEFPNSSIVNQQDDAGAHIFSTLLNAYVFLFLIAFALAIAIANSITKPLFQLGEKMKQTRLGQKNDLISWNNEDEIGELINDYNGMILKLDESAKLLAQSERDMAWREMAKQVAHEIKNPLTPMKLSIQYLQNAIREKKNNITPLAGRVSQTLIEQIDNLAKIATEFSNFAKMPTSNQEKLVLNDIVKSIHDLFRKRDDMEITLHVPLNEIIVFADKNQLLRVLNNLMKNAIQSIPDGRFGRISITLYEKNNIGMIEVRDNGCGIPDEMHEQVFYPNFTTKSSGTGLGLAMSSNIINAFDGRLYFETEVDTGSCFYIELPTMKKDVSFD